jgi:hypothetical protein
VFGERDCFEQRLKARPETIHVYLLEPCVGRQYIVWVNVERISGQRAMPSRNHASSQALPTDNSIASGRVAERRRRGEMSCAECRRSEHSLLSFRHSTNQ